MAGRRISDVTRPPVAESGATYLPAACHALMGRSPVPMAELGGAGYLVRYVNPAFCGLVGKSRQAMVGRPFVEAVQDGDSFIDVFDRVYRGGEAETHAQPEDAAAGPVFWSYAVWPVLDAGQRPAGLMLQVTETTGFHRRASEMNEALLVSSVRQHEETAAAENLNERLRAEIVQRERAEHVLRENEQRLGLALEASQLGQWDLNLIDHTAHRTLRHDQIFGYRSLLPEWTYEMFLGHVLPDDRAAVDGKFQAAFATGEPWDFECRIRRADDAICWIWARGEIDRNATGAPRRLIGTIQDISERKRTEQRQQLLLDELAHRGKNLLAVIQTIIARSLSGDRPVEEAREALIQRIHALARSQSMLVNGAFEGASLAEIVRLEVEAFSDRVRAVGPALVLSPRATQTFALLLHELATNAMKHGSLSRRRGRIRIEWSVGTAGAMAGAMAGEDAAADPAFRFRWRERGGPPAAPPTRQGFGRVLTERVAAQEFEADIGIDYAPAGLTYELVAPLSAVAAGARGRAGDA